MALKSVVNVDGNRFDDELSSTEIAYLAKNFIKFIRNNNRKARGKNNVEPRNFKRNEPTKANNFEKSKEKVCQTSNNFWDNNILVVKGMVMRNQNVLHS